MKLLMIIANVSKNTKKGLMFNKLKWMTEYRIMREVIGRILIYHMTLLSVISLIPLISVISLTI